MRNAQAFAGICIMDVLYLVALVHIAHADLYDPEGMLTSHTICFL
jgi:hypothetical protein